MNRPNKYFFGWVSVGIIAIVLPLNTFQCGFTGLLNGITLTLCGANAYMIFEKPIWNWINNRGK